MNTVPVTVKHAEVFSSVTALPVFIIQHRYSDGLSNYAIRPDLIPSSVGDGTVAVFRIYRKGQNPQALIRLNESFL